MNEVFPRLKTVSLATATAGAIVRIPRASTSLLALVTDEPAVEDSRSFVILNATDQGRPRAEFVNNWSNRSGLLAYDEPLRYELSMAEANVDVSGRTWLGVPGALISLEDEMYLQAAIFQSHFGSIRCVNIRNGSVFKGQIPNYSIWTFGVWSVCLRDPIHQQSTALFDFDVHKQWHA
jgi:hypothetical protein